ncbi:hypothetical protein [Mycobacteroides salmoniphilum]|uniref:hypothetical protein n=1 Tax=Mycobacteroides salmoniphilum TaxID=404941 RepID=UPI001F3ECAB4|nr:hypothetical protein [Mycobacteroides salmoniphilum]
MRHPTSVPAIAATAFGVSLWFWILVFIDAVWSVLPPIVHAVSIGGWAAISLGAYLQVFIIGIAGDTSPARIRRGLRTTSLVAIIALIVVAMLVSQSPVLMSAGDGYELAAALYSGGDPWALAALVISDVYLMAVVVQLAWIGFRHADRTPLGVGLGLMAIAGMFQFAASLFGGIWAPLAGGEGLMGSAFGRWLQTWPGCIAAILMLAGFLWPPVMLRVQARRELRRLRPLHEALAGMFPGLFPPVESRIRSSDLVFEWTTHVQDGLTLLAQSRRVPLTADSPPPKGSAERSLNVANWLVGEAVPEFSCDWLRPPEGVSEGTWLLAIADAYRERQERLEAPASLSGMPSTLRR